MRERRLILKLSFIVLTASSFARAEVSAGVAAIAGVAASAAVAGIA